VRALVTGGAGLIGSHLADLLLDEGFEVRVLDSLEPMVHPQGRPSWVHDDMEFIAGRVEDEATLDRALKGVDVVFHQAAFGGFVPGVSRYFETNVLSACRLLERIAAGRSPAARVVFASTQAVYGEGKYHCPQDGVVFPGPRAEADLRRRRWEPRCPACGSPLTPRPTDEGHIDPRTPYAVSKAAAETTFLQLGRHYGIEVVGLRYALTYGPRQSVHNPHTGICSIFTTRLVNGRPALIFEDGRQTRDFIYVGDVARANLLVSRHAAAAYRAFNVGTGAGTSINEFVARLAAALGCDRETVHSGEFRPGEVRHLVTDAAALHALGWRPLVSLDEGLAHYVRWARSQGRLPENFTAAADRMRASGVIRGSSGGDASP